MANAMFFEDWLSNAKRFLNRLAELGGTLEQLTIEFAPPLTAAEMAALERLLPVELPGDLREIFTRVSSCATIQYSWEPPASLQSTAKKLWGQRSIRGGGVLFDGTALARQIQECREFAANSWLAEADFAADQQYWLQGIPFLEMANGDYLALDSNTEAVTYLSHDGSSRNLNNSLSEFLAAWESLKYVGPEFWVLERFIDPSSCQLASPAPAIQIGFDELFGKLSRELK